jgi:hypothetical protein
MLQVSVHWIHRVLAWLILAGLVVEFYLAGAPVFRAVTFAPHVELGRTLGTAILVLFVLGLIDRIGPRVLRLSALLLGLMIVQWVLPALGAVLPWLAALHAIVGMALIGATFRIAGALGTRVEVRRPATVSMGHTDQGQPSPVAP